jgi:hypothetical protein
LVDLVGGDAGARRGWDVQAIRNANRAVVKAQAALAAADEELNSLRLDREALSRRPLPDAPLTDAVHAERDEAAGDMAAMRTVLGELSQSVELLVERDRVRERLAREQAQLNAEIEVAYEARDAAREALTSAAAQLKHVRFAGRTWPLPDTVPTARELRREHAVSGREGAPRVALDEESWEDALTRAHIPIDIYGVDDEPLTTRIRRELNLQEFAAILGMGIGGLSKRLRGASSPLFALEGPESPLIVIGHRDKSRLRFIDVEKLPESLLSGLLPEQREMMEHMLGVPMGSTRWGGRVMPKRGGPSA